MKLIKDSSGEKLIADLRRLTADVGAAGISSWSSEALTEITDEVSSLLECRRKFFLAQQVNSFGVLQKCLADGSMSCSETLCDLFMLSPAERRKLSLDIFLDRLHPEDRGRIVSMLETCEKEGQTASGDCRLQLPDHRVFYVRISSTPMYVEGRHCCQLIMVNEAMESRRAAFLRDVQHEFSRALGAGSIEELMMILLRLGLRVDGIDLGAVFMAGEGNDGFTLTAQIGFDRSFVRDFGRIERAFITDVIGLGDHPIYMDCNQVEALGNQVSRAGGGDDFRSLAMIPVMTGAGLEAVLVFGSRLLEHIPGFARSILELIGADVSSVIGRFQAERALRKSEENYRLLVENQTDLMVKIGVDGIVRFASLSCRDFFRGAEKEPVGLHFRQFLRRRDLIAVLRRLGELNGPPHRLVFEQGIGGEDERWLSWQCSAIIDRDHGEVTAYLCIGRDITESRKAENLLRQSERRLRLILKAVSDCLWDWDLVGDELTFDHKLYDILGYADNEIKISFYDIIRNFVHIEDRRRVEREIKDLIDGLRETFDCSFRMRRRNGDYVWILMRAVLIKSFLGEPVRMVGCLEDITDRKNFDRIKENYTFLQKILDALPLPVYYKDMNGRYMGYNKAMTRCVDFYRRKTEEIIGHTAGEVMPDEYRYIVDRVEQEEQKLLKEGGHSCFNIQLAEGGNAARELVMHKSLVYGAGNEPECIVGAMIDVTDLKKTENALKVASQRLNTILNVMHEIIIWFDCDMRVVWANRAAYEAFGGMTGQDITGMRCRDIWLSLQSRDNGAIPVDAESFLEGSGDRKEVFRLQDGRIFQTWFYPVSSGSGENGWVQLALDVTEQEVARDQARLRQEQLIQADKMTSLGILVSGVAHEINNPNNFIVINVSILKKAWQNILKLLDEYAGDKGEFNVAGVPYSKFSTMVTDLLEGIEEGAERIRVIVNDLKDYVRQTPTDLKGSFNVNDALSRAFTLCRNMIKRATNNYKIIYGNNLPVVRGDVYRIEQVIINIVQNACHALKTRENAITVSTYSAGEEEVVIEVVDEGSGIPPEQVKHITDPFYTTKRDIGGTGLGLAISSSIVEEHCGRLEIESEVGVGTTVRIFLPIPSGNAEPNVGRTPGGQSLKQD